MRSEAQYAVEGEKGTAFFLNLENGNNQNATLN